MWRVAQVSFHSSSGRLGQAWGSAATIAYLPSKWRRGGARPLRLDVYPIDTRCRLMEHRGALGRGAAFRQPFEGVVQHVVGVGHLVDREIALEHAPGGAELLDAVGHEGGHRRRKLFRADGRASRM